MTTFKSPYSTKPIEVQNGDKFVFVVVASVGYAEDWAAYRLPFGEHQGSLNELTLLDALQYCAAYGEKLDEATARGLFPVLSRTDRYYRD